MTEDQAEKIIDLLEHIVSRLPAKSAYNLADVCEGLEEVKRSVDKAVIAIEDIDAK